MGAVGRFILLGPSSQMPLEATIQNASADFMGFMVQILWCSLLVMNFDQDCQMVTKEGKSCILTLNRTCFDVKKQKYNVCITSSELLLTLTAQLSKGFCFPVFFIIAVFS